MPGEITLHSNMDRHICIKTHAKASPENNTWLTSKSTPKGLVITNWSLWHDNEVQSFENNRIKLTTRGTSQEACHDAFIHRLPPTPAPSQARSLQVTHQQKQYPEQQIIARLSILILNKTYPSVTATSPALDMKCFLTTRVSFAEKQQRLCPYFQGFSTSSSWLLISKLASYCKHKLCNAINQA
jgi:hypothetical protein